mmetsp:Transcript_78708/g.138856  ORF Transcript_78708/g.138856 Transcript_78708/m.138856 type:complete len:1576 (+) Transcript_78708:47-4774(+)
MVPGLSEGAGLQDDFLYTWNAGVQGILAASYNSVLQERLEWEDGLRVQTGKKRHEDLQAQMTTMRNKLAFDLTRLCLPPGPSSLRSADFSEADGDVQKEPLWLVVESMCKREAEKEKTSGDQGGSKTSSKKLALAATLASGDAMQLQLTKLNMDKSRREVAECWDEFWTFYRENSLQIHEVQRIAELASASPRLKSSPRLKGKQAVRKRIEQEDEFLKERRSESLRWTDQRKELASRGTEHTEHTAHTEQEEQSDQMDDVVLPVQEESEDEEEVVESSADFAEEMKEEDSEEDEEDVSRQTSQAPEKSPSSHRGSVWQRPQMSVASKKDLRRGAQGPMHNLMQLGVLPSLVSQDNQKAAVRCYKGYRDVRRRHQLMEDMPPPPPPPSQPGSKNQERQAKARKGLALSRLPQLTPRAEKAESQPVPVSARARVRSRKAMLEAEEEQKAEEPLKAVRELSDQPSRNWSESMHQLIKALEWRHRAQGSKVEPSGILTTREAVGDPPMLFHRPWSRGKGPQEPSDKSDGYLSPLQRYAKVCLKSGVTPQPELVSYLGQLPPKLDFRGRGYSDEDVLTLAASLPYSEGLEAVDFGENNRLTDLSVCGLLRALNERHTSQLRSVHLDNCSDLSHGTISLFTKLIKTSMLELQVLDLSGILIGKAQYPPLAEAIESHPRLHDVGLAKTGLGFSDGPLAPTVIASLVSNLQIQSLELAYNHFDAATFEVLGKGVAESVHLKYLGLGSTAASPDQRGALSPMNSLLEVLAGDKHLRSLNISNNALDGYAAIMMEYAFQKHPSIQKINVSSNPLGSDGLRSMLRLLADDGCPELDQIQFEDTGGDAHNLTMGLFDLDPSGSYSIDMSHPGQRSLVRLLLTKVSELGGLKSSYIRNATWAQEKEESSYSVDSVRMKKGLWQVPTHGFLNFEVNFHEYFLRDEQDFKAFPSAVVERMYRKRKLTMERTRKVLAVCVKVMSSSDKLASILLEGLGKDFLVTAEQLTALSHGKETAHAMSVLLPCLAGPPLIHRAALQTKHVSDLMALEKGGQHLMSLNLENPTDHYELNMENMADRCAAQRLMLLNRWQAHIWKQNKLIDNSQAGNGKCFRNTQLDARHFVWKPEEWRMFHSGELVFDYVPLCRPQKGTEALSEEVWHETLEELKRALGTHRRKNELDEADENGMSHEQVTWVLKAISSRVWIRCHQLRSLLCVFLDRDDRASVLTVWFMRCIDWPINNKVCEAKFSQQAWLELVNRLGYLNLFPYFQPELSSHNLDLVSHEQRRVLHVLVRLSNAEHISNIKKPKVDWNGPQAHPEFVPFTAGIPLSWENFDAINTQGNVELSYACSMENVKLKTRRRLAATVGGWGNLPDDQATLASSINFWATLESVPEEVVKVIVFMIRNYSSINSAFGKLNGDGDNSLNHKEFVSNLQRVGCCRSKKVKEQMTGFVLQDSQALESYDEHDSVQYEQLSSVYRFLDSSNDGEISRKEFDALERIWKELHQSMYEFKKDMETCYGTLSSAYETADEDGSDALSFEEFTILVQATRFDGPIKQIFLFMDMNGDDEIQKYEFELLNDYAEDPPLGLD